MSTKHTPEPWHTEGAHIEPAFLDRDGHIARCYADVGSADLDRANAARAVACVNACAGIEDPAAALAAAREELAALATMLESFSASGEVYYRGFDRSAAFARAALALLGGAS